MKSAQKFFYAFSNSFVPPTGHNNRGSWLSSNPRDNPRKGVEVQEPDACETFQVSAESRASAWTTSGRESATVRSLVRASTTHTQMLVWRDRKAHGGGVVW
jgi:hypothetical protein